MKQLTALFFLLFFFFLFLLSSKAIAAAEVICDPKEQGEDFTCRPNACKPCNQTDKFEADCATTVTAKTTVTFKKGEAKCVERKWGGDIILNPKGNNKDDITATIDDVKIPFVGYKVPAGTEVRDFEQKYLSDYFEGTSEYYQQYANYWFDWIDHAGIFRKLAPLEYQNQTKEKMVKRAVDSVAKGKTPILQTQIDYTIHDYKIIYVGRLCWDTPFPTDLFIAILNRLEITKNLPILGQIIDAIKDRAHFCMYEGAPWDNIPTRTAKDLAVENLQNLFKQFNNLVPPFLRISMTRTYGEEGRLSELLNHFPPSPADKDYNKKYEDWKTQDRKKDEKVGKWYKLWQATMMFSREDTPGYVMPHMGTKPEDTTNEKNLLPQDMFEKVPHVARLYEASKEVASLLLPFGSPGKESPRRLIPPDPPRPPANACGQEGAIPIPDCNQQALSDSDPNDSICCEVITLNFTAVDIIENPGYDECQAALATSEVKDDAVCDQEVQKTVERRVLVNLEHPYLKEIWDQTSNALVSTLERGELETTQDVDPTTAGVFNAFRPNEIAKFPDLEGVSQVNIKYQKNGQIQTEPVEGQFYFNHLGGVQWGKEWVIKALMPFKQ